MLPLHFKLCGRGWQPQRRDSSCETWLAQLDSPTGTCLRFFSLYNCCDIAGVQLAAFSEMELPGSRMKLSGVCCRTQGPCWQRKEKFQKTDESQLIFEKAIGQPFPMGYEGSHCCSLSFEVTLLGLEKCWLPKLEVICRWVIHEQLLCRGIWMLKSSWLLSVS